MHESFILSRGNNVCDLFIFLTLCYKTTKKNSVSNRSQVLLISMRGFLSGKREIRKNNLLSAVTRRRLHRFMYISENIYRLDIFILCVFFRSRIKISVNNKLYMKQICHMSPARPRSRVAGECGALLKAILRLFSAKIKKCDNLNHFVERQMLCFKLSAVP
jgi:hypothetical protein